MARTDNAALHRMHGPVASVLDYSEAVIDPFAVGYVRVRRSILGRSTSKVRKPSRRDLRAAVTLPPAALPARPEPPRSATVRTSRSDIVGCFRNKLRDGTTTFA